jgi:catechol 2,3-dioxygenase-like lactoylglutathione lyase family enzyme
LTGVRNDGVQIMNNLYARSVFFVKDAERSLRFYVDELGFAEDWNYREEGRTFVCQVSLFGFELILNEVYGATRDRAGHGRVFIGLDDDQLQPLLEHIAARNVRAQRLDWGRPTLVIRDLDENELFFWLPNDDFTGLATVAAGSLGAGARDGEALGA